MAETCEFRVRRYYEFRACGKAAKHHDPDGWHCGIHSNAAAERRAIKKKAKQDAQSARWKAHAVARRIAEAEAAEQARRAGCYDGLVTALEEIAWPLKDEPACSGVKVLPKTVSDLREIATNALAEARKDVPK